MSTTKGYIIKKDKGNGRYILFDGVIYTNYDMANAILHRLSDEWDIYEVKSDD